ncbi:lytic murein transglycosylase [Henriciella aquimarina]|uniref:lytic murein transglycosylase n=1 Tax=Henriciella aquimarina TaxID=545261 RepID=UPI000A001B91|nr:lytic murein transglycosylase [Henriciella aquimarina]
MNDLKLKSQRWVYAAALSALIGACAATPQTSEPGASPAPGAPGAEAPQPQGPGDPTGTSDGTPYAGPTGPFTPSGNLSMDRWREDFANRARSKGENPAVVYAILEGISPLELYLSEDVGVASTGIADQAEFAKAIWEYLRTAVTNSRFETGQQKLRELSPTFDTLEQTYGVNREAIAAIWAMETNFGSYIGNYDAANTLSNMAVEGRRRSFAENQLYALMEILEKGFADREQLGSGWAGAMGQTQFMPTTYLAYAQDYDRDGHADIWANAPDALASAANYLSSSGYVFDEPWGIEILAPANFDWSYADGNERRMATWKSLGLSPIRGGGFDVDDNTYAELWLPAGAEGPKYLLFKNFNVFKTYNNADSYALAVGLLADGMEGKYGPVAAWPKHIERLSTQEVMTLQETLNDLGFEAGPVDGIPGRGTKAALQRFQKAQGMPADGYPSGPALDAVLAAAGS